MNEMVLTPQLLSDPEVLLASELLEDVLGNEAFFQIFTEGILRCLDAWSHAQAKAVSRATKGICDEAGENDFQLQMGKILFLRNRHTLRFQQQIVDVENTHLKKILAWIVCEFVLAPSTMILHYDLNLIPAFVTVVPSSLALIAVFMPSKFNRVPLSGHSVLQRHEKALWKVTENKLFSHRDRKYLRSWSLAISIVPLLITLGFVFWPGSTWLPYVSLIPSGLLMLIPMVMRYCRSRELAVFFKQMAATFWIAVTAVMTWLLTVDIDDINDIYLQMHMSGTAASIWSLVMLVGVCLTVTFPIAFTLVNYSRAWVTTAACGACGIGLEITVLCYLFLHKDGQHWPSWCFLSWEILAGLVGAWRISMILLGRLPGLTECWIVAKCAEKPSGAGLFVLPPLLPPTINNRALAPSWQDQPRRRLRRTFS